MVIARIYCNLFFVGNLQLSEETANKFESSSLCSANRLLSPAEMSNFRIPKGADIDVVVRDADFEEIKT